MEFALRMFGGMSIGEGRNGRAWLLDRHIMREKAKSAQSIYRLLADFKASIACPGCNATASIPR
jgi:hypothetical protein